jgi:hypothetical protein
LLLVSFLFLFRVEPRGGNQAGQVGSGLDGLGRVNLTKTIIGSQVSGQPDSSRVGFRVKHCRAFRVSEHFGSGRVRF